MAHSVNDINQLHIDAKNLLNNVVLGTADGILSKLDSGIETLKTSWKGTDAGKNINDLITVYNGIATFRNSLAELAKTVADIAVDYDRLQETHGGVSANLTALDYTTKSLKDAYSDSFPGVDITEAAVPGRDNVDAARNAYETFKTESTSSFNAIMQNWTEGNGHDAAEEAFGKFNQKAEEYTDILNTVSVNISTVLTNYQIS